MDEDFLDVYESGNKFTIFILLLVIISAFVAGYFFIFKKINVSPINITVELGATLSDNINDYLNNPVKDTKSYKLDLSRVDVNKVDTYIYTVRFKNKIKTAKINVVDTTPPVFEVKDYEMEAGDEDFYTGDLLSFCEDASMPCLVSFKKPNDEDKLSIPGEYNLTIVVSDIYKNSKEAKVNIKVIEKDKYVDQAANDLEYSHSSKDLPNFNNEYYIKLTKALKVDSEEAEDVIEKIDSEEILEYVKTNYPKAKFISSEIVEMYNKSNYIIGFVVKITINDGVDKTVYMTK